MLLGNFERGIDTSVLTIQKMSPDATGTLIPNTQLGTLELYVTVESVRTRSANRLVNLSPMTRRQENNVIVETGTTMTFNGLILKGVANPARRMAMGTGAGGLAGADYVRIIWTEGSCTWTFIGVIENYEQDISKDASRYTLSVRHVDDFAFSGVGEGALVTQPVLTGTV